MTPAEKALGRDRAAQLAATVDELLSFADSVASSSQAVIHLPVPLRAISAEAAGNELARRIETRDPGKSWALATFVTSDGRRVGKASPFLEANLPASQDWFIRFSLADLHTRLASWFLVHTWRAAELASAARDSLTQWKLLVAAASARSLLEGVAAFTAEAQATIAEWDLFKQQGEPGLPALEDFRESFNRRVVELQYSTRIGQGTSRPPLFPSKNVVTYISKLAKVHRDYDLNDIYQWLCDAVHPSYGSATTFTVSRATHVTDTHVREIYARHPLEPLARTDFATVPTVAHAAADAVIAGGQILIRDLHRVRWLVHDFGFTTEAAFALKLDCYGCMPRPQRNDRCPCGSGRKFKACSHRWSAAGLPPDSVYADPSTS